MYKLVGDEVAVHIGACTWLELLLIALPSSSPGAAAFLMELDFLLFSELKTLQDPGLCCQVDVSNACARGN